MIDLFRPFVPESARDAVVKALTPDRDGRLMIGQGPKVDEFEKALAPWVGSHRVLTVNSGTSALQLALRLAGVGPGTNVVSTPMTCSATNLPILAQGADIVWADIDPSTGNIDPDSVDEAITSRTKAIMAVHWGGYPVEGDELAAIAYDNNLALIEDAAHAFGSTYRGRPIGIPADEGFVCFSFQAIKTLTTIDGGAIVCPRDKSYEMGRLLRWYGIDRETERSDMRCENDIEFPGMKWHMNDVNATIGLEQLKYTQGILDITRQHARRYREGLADVEGITLLDYKPDRESSYWLFTILVRDREDFRKRMGERGVMTSAVHSRNDLFTCFKKYRKHLPGVDEFSAHQVSIPVGWWLSDEDVETVMRAVKESV